MRLVIFERQRRERDKGFAALEGFAQDAARSAQQVQLVFLRLFTAQDTDIDGRVFVIRRDFDFSNSQQAVGKAWIAHIAPNDLRQHFSKLVL